MKKTTVIFDFGGVLMKTVDYSPRHTWDRKLGLPIGSVEKVVHGSEAWRKAQKGEITEEEYKQAIAKQLNLLPEQLSGFIQEYFSGDQLDMEIMKYIAEMRTRDIKVGLLSNDIPALMKKLEYLGIHTAFDTIVISALVGSMKPMPETYMALLSRMNVKPEQGIFVDDMKENILGAEAIGLTGIHYKKGMDLRVSLEPYFQ